MPTGSVSDKKASIAFIGTRGVPASYSGFETFVEEAGSRLAQRGWTVTVYNRSTHVKYKADTYKGMKLVKLPTIPAKATDTIVHTFLSVIHLLFHKHDIVYICGVGNSILAWIPRIRGMKVVLNVDGADWQREKWGTFARWFLRTSERIATITPDVVIADARAVQEYYRRYYNFETVFIPYGTDFTTDTGTDVLEKFGLEPDKYVLFVGRMVPENNAHILIQAFRLLGKEAQDIKLVIVGDAPYAEDYKRHLREIAGEDPRIVFTGYQFGRAYRQLSHYATVFVLASGVGGTHPVLVEQMGFGNCVIASDTPANKEVLGDAGLIFRLKEAPGSLGDCLRKVIVDEGLREKLKRAARERAEKFYSWEAVVDEYEGLFSELIRTADERRTW